MVAILIVCHNGELELKAAFLIYSLNKYLKGKYCIYVGIPEQNQFASSPSPQFFSFCKDHNVETIKFKNTFLSGKALLEEGDLVSNKIFACQIGFHEDFVVYLDTDTALLREFEIEQLVKDTTSIKLKPANRANIRGWDEIYKRVGLQMPVSRLISSIDRVEIPPYFNSGVLVMNRIIMGQLTEKWQYYFTRLSLEKNLKDINYPLFHRDQIALALAIIAEEIEYLLLEENYNFPVRGKKIHRNEIPYIVHYHNPFSVYFENRIKMEFMEFIRLYPGFMDESTFIWNRLFKSSWFDEKKTALLEYLRYSKYTFSQRIMRSTFFKNAR
jgi:hypothetical protein